MATTRTCLAQWSRGASGASFRPMIKCLRAATSLQRQQTRTAASNAGASGRKKEKDAGKKKKARKTFIRHDLKDMDQFALCDAMRYIRAFEVGSARNPKYELHVNLRTLKNGPVVRNRLRLPHPVKTDIRIAAICPPDSKQAEAAKKAGATLVGEDEIINTIKEGTIEFDRLLCHEDSIAKLNSSGLGRVLGPRALMPSAKTGTVVKDVAASVRDMAGGSEYREREGVVRLAIGALNFTPEMLQKNIKVFMEQLKKDLAGLQDRISKELHEVVLSSTNAPGFSLNGEFRGKEKGAVQPADLSRGLAV